MNHVLRDLYVVVAVVLAFGAAVFVHEFGHFWMARRRGLKGGGVCHWIQNFGWTKDGIDYSWRLIPAGGYVKLPQVVTSDAEGTRTDADKQLPPPSPFSRYWSPLQDRS